MRPSAVQMICLALGAVGLIGAIRCCILPQWIVWVKERKHMEYQKGLWMECLKQRTRQLECKLHDSMVASSSQLQAFRAMTIISCLLCGLSLLILIFGADFTPSVQNQDSKPKTILVAAVGLMLAGLLVIIPVSWVAHDVIHDVIYYYKQEKIGVSIYIGWAAGELMILAGVLLCCFNRPRCSSSGGTTTFCCNRALKLSAVVWMLCVTYGVIGQLGVIVCVILPRWRVSANSLNSQDLYEGLWMKCVTLSTGQQQYKTYDSMLELPFDLQAARVMTTISCILCGLSLFIMFFGADFTTCVQNENTKPKLILVAAVGLMLAGLLVIIPVSWSAHNTVRDLHSYRVVNSQKRELGESIYIGWAAGVVLIQAGCLLCCFGRPSNRASGPNDDAIQRF